MAGNAPLTVAGQCVASRLTTAFPWQTAEVYTYAVKFAEHFAAFATVPRHNLKTVYLYLSRIDSGKC